MNLNFRPDELASLCQAQARRGSCPIPITGIAALTEAAPGDLSFLGNARYKGEVPTSRASVILVPADYAGSPGPDQELLVVANPSAALASVCARLEQQLWPRPAPGIHPSAVLGRGVQVAPTASVGPLCVLEDGVAVGEGVHLQAQVFLGRSVRVGEGSWLAPGVVVTAECVLGRRVRLHPGVVVGADGFGYEFVQGRHAKVPQIGRVEIGDDVEIGANTTLDRARFGATTIGEGTKIDNLVQIAHNVRVGRHCILCAQTGVSGSTVIEDYVVLGGQAGVAGHLRLGRGAKVGGGAAVTTDLESGTFVNGSPAIPLMLERRIAVLKQRLPELFRRVETLEAQLAREKELPPAAAPANIRGA